MKRLAIIFLIGAIALLQAAGSDSFADSASEAAMAAFQKRFDEMDTNGDGKVDRAEYVQYEMKKANERFNEADQNGDGFITRKEAEQTMKKKQEEMKEKIREWREKQEQRGK